MMKRQFRVLYRNFLFGIVDRELLSTYATGDASQLLLQLAALLAFLSVCFCLPVFGIRIARETAYGRLMFAWSIEHLLIATTILVVGLCRAELGLDSPAIVTSTCSGRCPSVRTRSCSPGLPRPPR
jgi:hypothetical protein